MSELTRDSILAALSAVPDHEAGTDVVSAGLISGITLRGDKVGFLITIDPADKEKKAYLREICEQAVRQLPGVASVTAVLTAHNDMPIPPKPEAGYGAPRARAQWNLTPVEGVKKIIAIASGKGGVGKSTTAVNLAHALAAQGVHVGLLDADIYGPSIPRMMGLFTDQKPAIENGKMLPPVAHGVACMSMGFVTGDEAAILRGPMISKALQQLLRATQWGALDLLLIDLPPGTGDIHLSLAQQAPLSGALIVTTPQEVAVMDARKCAKMFQKLDVPVLGIIENMSWLEQNGQRIALFGEGGGARLAKEFNVPLLGQIPVEPEIGQAAEAGKIVAGDTPAMRAYAKIAALLRE